MFREPGLGCDIIVVMDTHEIRAAYLDLMTAREHVVIDRAPLVPFGDPTTLFTGSGMQPLLPYLLGAEHPAGVRLADSQPCVRSQDIEEVGDNRHTTFFEMLGNWSLGDYFKREQIALFWHFLTEVVRLDPDRIYVSVFAGDPDHGIPRDDESADIWTALFDAAGVSADRIDLNTEEHGNNVGNQGARIAFYGAENWWSRSGGPNTMPLGDPGGPDTEVFYYFPQVEHDTSYGKYSHQNSDGGQYMEIGNSVFMQYRRTEDGFSDLPRRNVDYGGGLERIAAASIDSPDVFKISVLWPIVEKVQEITGATYAEHTHAIRIIADHIRGAVFLAVDGVVPGNKEQGYVMRRLIRRAIRVATELGARKDFLGDLVPVVAEIYQGHYPEVAERTESVLAVLAKEEKAFRRTLDKGLRQLRAIGDTGSEVTGSDLFTLYDTYGFPIELSVEELRNIGMTLSPLWREDFDRQLDEQRRRSQQGARLGARRRVS
ncbi:alanine--tRNA ligase-related protein [Rhodococcus erythropolis]|uniref:alanine--tRNA ligase-related protein n=1 Tax=Rhodococcus erythropolis TaxID=1833 RepID=UPI002AD4EB8F|nr:alanine--tRNA ligase-related protein [Rhodococcus erythropolis]